MSMYDDLQKACVAGWEKRHTLEKECGAAIVAFVTDLADKAGWPKDKIVFLCPPDSRHFAKMRDASLPLHQGPQGMGHWKDGAVHTRVLFNSQTSMYLICDVMAQKTEDGFNLDFAGFHCRSNNDAERQTVYDEFVKWSMEYAHDQGDKPNPFGFAQC